MMSPSVHWQQQHHQSSSTTSARSDGSNRSYDTAPTEYSDQHRPSLARASETCHGRIELRHPEPEHDFPSDYGHHHDDDDHHHHHQQQQQQQQQRYAHMSPPWSSVETYASTSAEENTAPDDAMPDYQLPPYRYKPLASDAIPTTPRDFGDLFPTAKRLSIRHDDAAIDGNMNLRVDTLVQDRGHRKQSYTLFHLRMHDLRTREFSLRRYCRESGREVCHSIRKYQQPPAEKHPVLQRASTALASLVKSDARPIVLKRSDSGYDSVRGVAGLDDDNEDDDQEVDYFSSELRPKSVGYSKGRALIPTNTIKLEFSNYSHVDVKRRGTKASKRYAFEHWGDDYSWKRMINHKEEAQSGEDSISYYLVRDVNEKEPLAHICPARLPQEEAREEIARGGWVPPCYLRITDEKILRSDSDISDVVVATGLMALVDDCIKRRFHSQKGTQLHIPLLRTPSFKVNMEYIGPMRLIDEVFHRKHANSGMLPKRPLSALRRTPTAA